MARKSKKTGTGGKLNTEDKALWSHVSQKVTPIESNRFTGFEELTKAALTPSSGVSAPRGNPQSRKKGKEIPLHQPAIRINPRQDNHLFRETIDPTVRHNVPGIDRNTSERLRKGRMEIEGRVDLHGMTQKEAHSRLRSFLGSAHRSGKRCVLVITGKGSSVKQTDDAEFMGGGRRGVLREEVPKWLGQSDLRRLVLDYRTAQIKHGGEGALYILLRRIRG